MKKQEERKIDINYLTIVQEAAQKQNSKNQYACPRPTLLSGKLDEKKNRFPVSHNVNE